MVQERKFRADLYYRLNVFLIILPPLRERIDDIPLLVEHFVQRFAKQQAKSIDCVPGDVMELLQNHDWPGNVRELQNVIERAVIMTAGRALELKAAELRRRASELAPARTLADAERAHIIAVLRETNWVVGGRRGAAAQLGVPRTTLITMMQRHGIFRETLGLAGGDSDRIAVPDASRHSYAPGDMDGEDRIYHQLRSCLESE
jgi:formate hydrogenlyase transcriptional activator